MRPWTLIARVEAVKTLPRQDAPAPLLRRQVPTNVAVAVFPLLNDAKSVTEKVKVGRAAWKARVDDVDGVGLNIVLQTRPRVLTGAAAQHQKCHKDCCCAAHSVGSPPRGRGSMFALAPTLAQRKRGGARRSAHEGTPEAVYSLGAGLPPPRQRKSPPDL